MNSLITFLLAFLMSTSGLEAMFESHQQLAVSQEMESINAPMSQADALNQPKTPQFPNQQIKSGTKKRKENKTPYQRLMHFCNKKQKNSDNAQSSISMETDCPSPFTLPESILSTTPVSNNSNQPHSFFGKNDSQQQPSMLAPAVSDMLSGSTPKQEPMALSEHEIKRSHAEKMLQPTKSAFQPFHRAGNSSNANGMTQQQPILSLPGSVTEMLESNEEQNRQNEIAFGRNIGLSEHELMLYTDPKKFYAIERERLQDAELELTERYHRITPQYIYKQNFEKISDCLVKLGILVEKRKKLEQKLQELNKARATMEKPSNEFLQQRIILMSEIEDMKLEEEAVASSEKDKTTPEAIEKTKATLEHIIGSINHRLQFDTLLCPDKRCSRCRLIDFRRDPDNLESDLLPSWGQGLR